jgi:hypothetical protein
MNKTLLFRLLFLALFIASGAVFCLLVISFFEDDSNLLIRVVHLISGVVCWFSARTMYRNWQEKE